MNRKPYEQKQLQGTLRPDKERQQQSAEHFLTTTPVIFPKETVLPIPETLKTEIGRNEYKQVTSNMLTLGILSPADLPQIEIMCKYLEEAAKVQNIIDTLPFPFKTERQREDYIAYGKIRDRAVNIFNELAKKYYISPGARAELKLSVLTAMQKELDLQGVNNKNENDILKRLFDGREKQKQAQLNDPRL